MSVLLPSPFSPSSAWISPAATFRSMRSSAISAGSLLPFAGPIKDSGGALKVAAGLSVPADELMAINWYVEGVDGSVPR